MEQASRKTTIVRLQPIYEERTKSQIEKERVEKENLDYDTT